MERPRLLDLLTGGRVQQKPQHSASGPLRPRVVAMLPGVPITLWSAGRLPTMHPTSTVQHRSVLTRLPGSPRMGSAPLALVHGQVLHGLVPPNFAHSPRLHG